MKRHKGGKEVNTSKHSNSLIIKMVVPFKISISPFFSVFSYVYFVLVYILLTVGEYTFIIRCIGLCSWVYGGCF